MDSSAYKYLIGDILRNSSHVSRELPALFSKQTLSVNSEAFETVSFFLKQLIPESEKIGTEALPRPSILVQNEKDFFPLLFRTVHKNITEILIDNDTPVDISLCKRNGTELLRFLCHSVSPKWVPVFPELDALSYAMSCFLIEACTYMGWCPNAFENKAKRAAHCYFAHLKKSLHMTSDADLATILGYLQSVWICAQKTEGIRDEKAEWEHRDCIHRYQWELEGAENNIIRDFTLYRSIQPPVHIVIPRCQSSIPHPFSQIDQEGKTGLILYTDEGPLKRVECIDTSPIERPKVKGDKFTYFCTSGEDQRLSLTVALQIFANTVYRIDVLRPQTAAWTVSCVKLYLENSLPLSPVADDTYIGKGKKNSVIKFLNNPFGLTYAGQEEGKSIFIGGEKILAQNSSTTMITAWSVGKDISAIDNLKLLGIFDMPEEN